MLSLLIILIAFGWLLRETDYFRVRLLIGEDIPRYKRKMTGAEWQRYDKIHAKELKQAQKEYAERQAVIKAHTCFNCNARDEDVLIETKTITAGNSVCHVRACSDCMAKFEADIIKSQQPTKPKDPYPISHYSGGVNRGFEADYGDIDILVDGELKLSLNGDSKRGMVKDLMKNYTTKIKVGKKTVKAGFGVVDKVTARV